MKLIIFLLISNMSFALEQNHCFPNESTKKYLDFDFSAPYPKTATFICDYECKSKDTTEVIKAVRTVIIHNQNSEGTSLVCKGVIVKKGQWGFELDRIIPFFIYDNNMQEIRSWAKNENISIDDTGSEKLMKNLIKTLTQVSSSFQIAGTTDSSYSPEFHKAYVTIAKMIKELPTNTETLDYYVRQLEQQAFDLETYSFGEQLVLQQINLLAKWRIEKR